MKKIKEHKKEIIIFHIVFILSLLMCSAFLRPHYTHDTYRIIYDGYEFYSYDKFLKEARPFTAIITLIAAKINLSIKSYMLISFIIALVFLSIAVLLIYKLFRKQYKASESRWIDILILLISYITIFNYLAFEHIYFLECFILALGVLLSVIAAKIVINNEKYKYLKAFIIIIISAFCYQGSIAIFPMIVFTYKFLFENNKLKNNIVDFIKVVLIYGISMLLTILFAEFIMGGSRITMQMDRISISNILYWIYELVVNSLGVIPSYINLGIILITTFIIAFFKKASIKEKTIYILKYLFIILASIVVSASPVIAGSGLELAPRMCLAYGSTIGLSLFIILYIVDNNRKTALTTDKKSYSITKINLNLSNIPMVAVSVAIIIIFVLNITLYIVLTHQHLEVNKIEKENCEVIKQVIENYEKETGIEVTKIVGVTRIDGEKYYPGFIHAGAITQKGLNSWALRETICFYIGRHLKYASITDEQYKAFFGNKSWDEFSEEQVVIEGDVLYFCGN